MFVPRSATTGLSASGDPPLPPETRGGDVADPQSTWALQQEVSLLLLEPVQLRIRISDILQFWRFYLLVRLYKYL